MMVWIPKFYIKHVSDSSSQTIFICNEKLPGYRCYPAFLNNKKEIDGFYIGAYCGNVTDNKLCSNTSACTKGKTKAEYRTYALNRNVNGITGFMLQDVYQRECIKLLYLIEHGSPDVSSATYRGIYQLYGICWEYVDGIYSNADTQLSIYKNDGSREYIDTKIPLLTSSGDWAGYITTMKIDNSDSYDLRDIFIPDSVGTNVYQDQYSGAIANGDYLVGGYTNTAPYIGLFSCSFHYSNTRQYHGARIAKI